MSILTRRPLNSLQNFTKLIATTQEKFRSYALAKTTCDQPDPLMDLDCKIALVFGGAEGIGFAISHQIMGEKAKNIALVGTDICKGREAVNILNCTYGKNRAIFLQSDVKCGVQLCECYDKVLAEFGHIDVVVNSAGICDGINWESEVVTNFVGTTRSTILAFNHMSKSEGRNGGVILNVSGTHGLIPLGPAPTLSGSFHGIVGLSRSFGDERNFQRSKVRIVCLCPGVTQTNFVKDLENKGLNMEMGEDLKQDFCKAIRQKTDVCGKSGLHLLKFGPNGSVWVVEGSKLYSMDLPHWKKHSKLVSQFLKLSTNSLQTRVLIRRNLGDFKKLKKPGFSQEFSQKKTFSLEDKVAIITGGAEGIGQAIARTFLKNGACGVVIADINNDKGLETVSTLTCEHGEDKAIFIESDVSQSKQFDWIFKKTIQNFEKVDIVVNNAGVMNDVNWEGQIGTNLSSVVVGTLLGMQYMSKTCLGCGGHVVNVSSIIGMIPSTGYPIHTMTQFGIVGFSRAIGAQSHFERTGVKVISLCPGLTNTKLLKQAPYHAINDKFRKEFKEESGGCALQKPESVAAALLEILDKSTPGAVWVVENNSKPYEIRFPEVADMRFKNKS